MEINGKIYYLPEKLIIKDPLWVSAADETGDSTNMKQDNAKAMGKVIVPINSTAKKVVSNGNTHFTLLPIQTAAGIPLHCTIIIAAGSPLEKSWESGIDIFKIHSDELNPYGPRCVVNGLEIPCNVEVSESGGVTPQILVKALATIDASGVYGMERAEAACQKMGWDIKTTIRPDRNRPKNSPPLIVPLTSEGRIPVTIWDGHGSRYQLDLLRYIDLKGTTPWLFLLGVPNGTALWQTGDDEHQNGAYKHHTVIAKNLIFDKRFLARDATVKRKIEKSDIVVIALYAWERSFNNTTFTLEAFKRKGFYPFTAALMHHPEVVGKTAATYQTQESSSSSSSSSSSTSSSSSSSSSSTSSSSSATSSQSIMLPNPNSSTLPMFTQPPIVTLINVNSAATHMERLSNLGAIKSATEAAAIIQKKKAAESLVPIIVTDSAGFATDISRPMGSVKRMGSGETWGIDSAEILSSGETLREVEVRTALDRAKATQVVKTKNERAERRKTAFESLQSTKPDDTTWTTTDLRTALTYKTGNESKLKQLKLEALKPLWLKWKTKEPDAGDEDGGEGEEGEESVADKARAEQYIQMLRNMSPKERDSLFNR